jgi:hypothetical protein
MDPNMGEKDNTTSVQDAHGTPELINASGHVQELDRK